MSQYFAKFEEVLNKGDPELRKWFLIGSNYMPIVICVLYVLVSTKIGPALMRNRKPFDLRHSMVVFNFFIVAVYTVCFAIIAIVTWVLYLLKYVEFLDTIFFVLRKKQNLVSVLHVTHHSTLPLLMWLTARTETAALQLIPMYLNAFVHIVMYSYYGLAAMGPAVRKYLWWKKYITQLQIMQFFVIIFIGSVFVPLSGCKVGTFTHITNICFIPLILYLFFKFYMQAYQSRTKSKDVAVNSNKQEKGFSFSDNKDD